MVSDRCFTGNVKKRHRVSIRFEVRGGFRHALNIALDTVEVSIRFEVRGGFRRLRCGVRLSADPVSIRFEVRGGFRLPEWVGYVGVAFQSALRFAVVSDINMIAFVTAWLVSIRFEVRGGFRRGPLGPLYKTAVSIRFEVRGGFRHHDECGLGR